MSLPPCLCRCVRILGKQENIRVVQLSLFQGVSKAARAAPTVEMKACDNPALQSNEADPTIFCTAFKKNRFYMVCTNPLLHEFTHLYKWFKWVYVGILCCMAANFSKIHWSEIFLSTGVAAHAAALYGSRGEHMGIFVFNYVFNVFSLMWIFLL